MTNSVSAVIPERLDDLLDFGSTSPGSSNVTAGSKVLAVVHGSINSNSLQLIYEFAKSGFNICLCTEFQTKCYSQK